MGDITVTYRGSTILDTSASGTKTLNTKGKYLFDNITVQYSLGQNIIDKIIDGTITTYTNDRITTIGSCGLNSCTKLLSVNFPKCTTVYLDGMGYCSSLVTISFPKCKTLGQYAFRYCYSLASASFPSCTTIGSYAFSGCMRLIKLYLTSTTIATLNHSNAFTTTPIGGYSTTAGTFGSIYVPSSLLASYKAKTNWTYFSSRFVGI